MDACAEDAPRQVEAMFWQAKGHAHATLPLGAFLQRGPSGAEGFVWSKSNWRVELFVGRESFQSEQPTIAPMIGNEIPAAGLRHDPVRTTEVGLMVPGPPSAVDEIFTNWVSKGVHVVERPHDAV